MGKSYVMLDIMKFVMALLVVSIHSGKDYLSVVGQFAVPFFFTTSAMFFFKKYLKTDNVGDKVRYILKYEFRLGMVYGIWILLYIPLHVQSLTNTIDQNIIQLIKWTLMGNFPFFYAAWYISALMIGIVIMVACLEFIGYKTMILLGIVTQIIVLAVISYNGLLPQNVFALEPRVVNSVLRGLVYIALGYILAKNESRLVKFEPVRVLMGAAIGVGIVLVEQITIWIFQLNMKMEFACETMFMPLAVAMLVVAAININISRFSGRWFRQASSFIYFSHLMVIDLLAVWFVQNDLNSYQIFLIVVVTVSIAFTLIYLLKRFRPLAWLNVLV